MEAPQKPLNHGLFAPALLPTPHLPESADDYEAGRERAAADPIGTGGLPRVRADLNSLLTELCRRLLTAAGQPIGGRQLVEELLLVDTRSLRLLVAYGHVHHRLRQVVGVPGTGYFWGDFRPDLYDVMRDHARRLGRCWFFNAALFGKRHAAVEAAQLVLDFVGDAPAMPRPENDELELMMKAEGVGIESVLSAIVELLAANEQGRAALVRIGRRHAAVLVPRDVRDSLLATAASMLDQVRALDRPPSK